METEAKPDLREAPLQVRDSRAMRGVIQVRGAPLVANKPRGQESSTARALCRLFCFVL